MGKRSYHQYCGLAVALDVLGERWTMLVVRDLLAGPKRFTDLLDGLPGIGTGLLSQRLRELEAAGVIEKAMLPPPAASAVYQLTADGASLRPALLGLARWGLARLGEPTPGQHVNAEPLALAIVARFDPGTKQDGDGTYELIIDGRSFQLDIRGGHIEIHARHAERPRAVITTDSATLISLNNAKHRLADALADGTLTVNGDVAAIAPLAAVFGL